MDVGYGMNTDPKVKFTFMCIFFWRRGCVVIRRRKDLMECMRMMMIKTSYMTDYNVEDDGYLYLSKDRKNESLAFVWIGSSFFFLSWRDEYEFEETVICTLRRSRLHQQIPTLRIKHLIIQKQSPRPRKEQDTSRHVRVVAWSTGRI